MTDRTLLVTAGRGPIECHGAVARTARQIEKEASDLGLSFSVSTPIGSPLPSVVVSIGGEGADTLADGWTGTVKVIDPSARGRGGRRNFFVAVHALDAPVATPDLDLADVRFETMRAGGPGGQHQNTTDSAVRATHVPTGIATLARDGRSQHRNKALAVRRLATMLASIGELDAARREKADWLRRIDVERGNARRTID